MMSLSRWQKFVVLVGCLTAIHFVLSFVSFGVLFAWGEQNISPAELDHPPLGIAIVRGIFSILQANGWVMTQLYRPGIPEWVMLASFGIMSLVESVGILGIIFVLTESKPRTGNPRTGY